MKNEVEEIRKKYALKQLRVLSDRAQFAEVDITQYIEHLLEQIEKQNEVIENAVKMIENINSDSFDYCKHTLLDILKEDF